MLNTIWCIYLLRRVGIKLPFFKSLGKKFLQPIRVKLGRLTTGMLIASYSSAEPELVFIEAMWYRRGIFKVLKQDTFKVLFDTFMISYKNEFQINDVNKLTIVLRIEEDISIEDCWALDMHGFHPDPSATLDILEFRKPWREQEDLRFLVYSRRIP